MSKKVTGKSQYEKLHSIVFRHNPMPNDWNWGHSIKCLGFGFASEMDAKIDAVRVLRSLADKIEAELEKEDPFDGSSK